jgi:hypothetical protein
MNTRTVETATRAASAMQGATLSATTLSPNALLPEKSPEYPLASPCQHFLATMSQQCVPLKKSTKQGRHKRDDANRAP